MKKIAWQTSLLLNGTGNFKRRIYPKDLYQSPYEKEEESTQITLDKEEKEKRLAVLKKRFGKI